MGVAKDIQRTMSERGDASLEFAGGGHRLSLNPIEGRFEEIGFVLWVEEAGGALAPVAAGRAVGDELVLDGEPAGGAGAADVGSTIASLIAGEPVSALGGGGNESAIPTGT